MKIRHTLVTVGAFLSAAVSLNISASAADQFNAYIGFQNNSYSFRNSWDDTSYGAKSGYHDKFIVWGEGDEPDKSFPGYTFDYDLNGYALNATYEDVTIDKNGTYTVTAKDINWALDKASDFNLIFISTDAPLDAGIVCTEAKIIVDGTAVKTVKNPVCDTTQSHFNISIINEWNSDIDSYGLAYPQDSLAVEFTITGFKESSYYQSDGSSIKNAPVGTPVTQKTAVSDGKYNERFVQKAAASDVAGKTKATFTLSNGTATKTVSTTHYNTALTVDGEAVSAGSGYVFLVYTLSDIPDGVTVTVSGVTLE